MSILKRFAKTAFKTAANTIGGDVVTINGGRPVMAVLNAVNLTRKDKDTGFQPDSTFAATLDADEFAAAYKDAANTYLGKKALIGKTEYRITAIDVGKTFVKLSLETISKG